MYWPSFWQWLYFELCIWNTITYASCLAIHWLYHWLYSWQCCWQYCWQCCCHYCWQCCCQYCWQCCCQYCWLWFGSDIGLLNITLEIYFLFNLFFTYQSIIHNSHHWRLKKQEIHQQILNVLKSKYKWIKLNTHAFLLDYNYWRLNRHTFKPL